MSEEEEHPKEDAQVLYGRPIAEIDDFGLVTIRASQLMSCRRRLYYSAIRAPQSDELPASTRLRMEMGTALETVVLDTLARDGWTILTPVVEGEVQTIRLDDDLLVSGIRDAIGRPPGGAADGVIEVKTRNSDNMRRIKEMGSYVTHPGAVAQLAVYREMALERQAIEDTATCWIANLNKDSAEIHTEEYSPEFLEKVLSDLSERTVATVNRWIEDVPPERDYETGSWQCRSCEWRRRCGNVEPEPYEEPEPTVQLGGITIDDARMALLQYEQHKNEEESHRMDPNYQEWCRSQLLEYCQQQGVTKLALGAALHEYSISVMQRDTVSWNAERIQRWLSPEQLKEAMEVKTGNPYVVIRKGKAI